MRGAPRVALRTLLVCLALTPLACSEDAALDAPVPPRPTALPAAAARPLQADFAAPTRPPPRPPQVEERAPSAPPFVPEPRALEDDREPVEDAGNGLPL